MDPNDNKPTPDDALEELRSNLTGDDSTSDDNTADDDGPTAPAEDIDDDMPADDPAADANVDEDQAYQEGDAAAAEKDEV